MRSDYMLMISLFSDSQEHLEAADWVWNHLKSLIYKLKNNVHTVETCLLKISRQ